MDCNSIVNGSGAHSRIAFADRARGNAGGSCRGGVFSRVEGRPVYHRAVPGSRWREHFAKKQISLNPKPLPPPGLLQPRACYKLKPSSELFAPSRRNLMRRVFSYFFLLLFPLFS